MKLVDILIYNVLVTKDEQINLFSDKKTYNLSILNELPSI